MNFLLVTIAPCLLAAFCLICQPSSSTGSDIKVSEVTNASKEKLQMLVDMVYEKIRVNMAFESNTTTASSVSILGESYRLRKLRAFSSGLSKIKMVAVKGGTYYYERWDIPNKLYYITQALTDSFIDIQDFYQDDFFKTVQINYTEPTHLTFGNILLHTDDVFPRYIVAHHLLETVHFVGFGNGSLYGVLYSADISSSYPGSTVIAEKIKITDPIDALTVDQFTGNILFGDLRNNINIFEKMSYLPKMNDLTEKRLRLGF